MLGGFRSRCCHAIAAAIAVFAIGAFGPERAEAQRMTFDNGFRSPSGNIHCQYFDSDAVLRCDLKEISNRPLPRPRDCKNEWGQAFEAFGRRPETGPICYGDTVMDDRLPVLGYGERWERGDFVCRSERTGVSCLNSLGVGFELSRSAQKVLRASSGGGSKPAGGNAGGSNSGSGKSIGGSVN